MAEQSLQRRANELDRIKRNILDGFAANARSPDEPDGPERKE